MAQNRPLDELDDWRSLADMVRWMNAQCRPPGAKRVVFRHRGVRKQLEMLGLRFQQPNGERGKLYFKISDLQFCAPLLARAFLAT